MVNSTREIIVDLALKLIQKKGYSSFSYDDIAKKLNITKAAIHYHFANKEDLGIAVCKKTEKIMCLYYGEVLENIRKHTETPWKFVVKILSTIKPNENCPISSLQADYEILPAQLRNAVCLLSKLQIELFVNLAKEYSPNINEKELTTLFLSIKGAIQYRRIFGDVFFETNINTMKRQYETLLKNVEV